MSTVSPINTVLCVDSSRKEAWSGARYEVKTPEGKIFVPTPMPSRTVLIEKAAMEQARLHAVGIKMLKRFDAPDAEIKMPLKKFCEWLSCEAKALGACAYDPVHSAKITKIFNANLQSRIHEIKPAIPCIELPLEGCFPKITLVTGEKYCLYSKYEGGYFSREALAVLKVAKRTLTRKAEVDAIVTEAIKSEAIAWRYTVNGCDIRAKILYYALRYMGIPKEAMVFQYHRGPNLLHNWRYHVALAVILTNGELLVLDPVFDPLHSMTVEDWVRKFHHDKNYRVFTNDQLEIGDCSDVQTFHVSCDYYLQIDGDRCSVEKEREHFFTEFSNETALYSVISQLFKCVSPAPQLTSYLEEISLNPCKLWLPPAWRKLMNWVESYATAAETTKKQPQEFGLTLEEISGLTWKPELKVTYFDRYIAKNALQLAWEYLYKEIIKVKAREEILSDKISA